MISGLPFGLLHYFNQNLFRDAVYGVVIGMVFAWVYILAQKRGDIHPVLATALVYPLMAVIFLSFNRNWSYIIFAGIFLFSSILLVDSAYQFHYNLQHSRFNAEWLRISLIWSALLTSGLWMYYRYFTRSTYVFP